ncbi:MAG: FixH family protein [Byssovorax sp.]
MHSVRHHGSAAFLASMALVGAALTAGCGSGESAGGTGGQASSSTATASSSSGSQPAAACAKDPRTVPYAVGVEAKSTDGALTVQFMDADPAPPTKGNNTWRVKLVDAAGKPVNGATIVTKPYMPDHAHGSSIKPQATAKGTDGTYEITPVNLFMPGVWQITFTVTAPGGMAESAVVSFCVDG